MDADVRRTAVQANGQILVGGGFTTPSYRLARFNADGTRDTTFNVNVGTTLNGRVEAISVQANGQIVVGGLFTSPSTRLARFNADGTPDTTFNANVGTTIGNGQVSATAIQPDGKIVAGGSFASPRRYLARFNADGTPDTTFNSTNVFNVFTQPTAGAVTSASVQADGGVVVSGIFRFTSASTVTRNLARINADGTQDTTFTANVGTSLDGTALRTSIQADGKIVVSGNFTTPSRRLARFDSNGTPDMTFNSSVGTSLTAAVRAMFIQADGKILLGWSSQVVRFNADGSPDTVFNTNGSLLGSAVWDIVGADDKFVVGSDSSPGLTRFAPPCGEGIALTTSPTALWQQFALPCRPSDTFTTVGGVLGGNTTGQLDAANFTTRWSLWQRNASNSGNVAMTLTSALGVGTGHWIKSLDAPVGGMLRMDATQARPTQLTRPTGCPANEGCAVLRVSLPGEARGTRMIANPFPHDVNWSQVIVRVGGEFAGTRYTPTGAQTAGILSKQIWIWNGTSYGTWTDTSPTLGNLQYFKSFFVQVLPGGEGQAIDLLIPALASTVPTTTALQAGQPASLAAAKGSDLATTGRAATSSAAADASATRDIRSAWVVDLGVHNVETGWNANGKLGQWPGAETGSDPFDMLAMAPFGQPYLTVVFPRAERRSAPVDYSADFRPANGFASRWDFEVRAQPLGSNVVLRWNVPAAVLNKSRIIDRDTGLVVYPTDPGYANGYPMTLDTPVRRLTWEYLGN